MFVVSVNEFLIPIYLNTIINIFRQQIIKKSIVFNCQSQVLSEKIKNYLTLENHNFINIKNELSINYLEQKNDIDFAKIMLELYQFYLNGFKIDFLVGWLGNYQNFLKKSSAYFFNYGLSKVYIEKNKRFYHLKKIPFLQQEFSFLLNKIHKAIFVLKKFFSHAPDQKHHLGYFFLLHQNIAKYFCQIFFERLVISDIEQCINNWLKSELYLQFKNSNNLVNFDIYYWWFKQRFYPIIESGNSKKNIAVNNNHSSEIIVHTNFSLEYWKNIIKNTTENIIFIGNFSSIAALLPEMIEDSAENINNRLLLWLDYQDSFGFNLGKNNQKEVNFLIDLTIKDFVPLVEYLQLYYLNNSMIGDFVNYTQLSNLISQIGLNYKKNLNLDNYNQEGDRIDFLRSNLSQKTYNIFNNQIDDISSINHQYNLPKQKNILLSVMLNNLPSVLNLNKYDLYNLFNQKYQFWLTKINAVSINYAYKEKKLKYQISDVFEKTWQNFILFCEQNFLYVERFMQQSQSDIIQILTNCLNGVIMYNSEQNYQSIFAKYFNSIFENISLILIEKIFPLCAQQGFDLNIISKYQNQIVVNDFRSIQENKVNNSGSKNQLINLFDHFKFINLSAQNIFYIKNSEKLIIFHFMYNKFLTKAELSEFNRSESFIYLLGEKIKQNFSEQLSIEIHFFILFKTDYKHVMLKNGQQLITQFQEKILDQINELQGICINFI